MNCYEKKIPRNIWKIRNTTGRFLAQLHRSNFLLKFLFLVPKVSNSWIFQKRSFMKIIWHRISIQTLYFKTCLPSHQDGFQTRNKVCWNFENILTCSLACSRLSESRNGQTTKRTRAKKKGVNWRLPVLSNSLANFFPVGSVFHLSPLSRSLQQATYSLTLQVTQMLFALTLTERFSIECRKTKT